MQTYRDLRLLLRRELNTDPDPTTLALFQQVRAKARRQREIPPGVPSPPTDPPARQMPYPLTALVGRKAELEQIVPTLSAARLLTLTGPGGVGKTRLAIATAEQAAEEYPEGVFFVDLAPFSDPALPAQAVAAALLVREETGRPLLQTLQETLRSRTLLLILDNCEHLLDSCADLIQGLLQTCPGVHILATSRQSLGLTGEVVWRVNTLSTPVLSDFTPRHLSFQKDRMSLLSEYEAIQLFVIRAQQVSHSFQMTPQNAETIAHICAHLDGLPLALELAAARVRSLSVEEIHSKTRRSLSAVDGRESCGAAPSENASGAAGLVL